MMHCLSATMGRRERERMHHLLSSRLDSIDPKIAQADAIITQGGNYRFHLATVSKLWTRALGKGPALRYSSSPLLREDTEKIC